MTRPILALLLVLPVAHVRPAGAADQPDGAKRATPPGEASGGGSVVYFEAPKLRTNKDDSESPAIRLLHRELYRQGMILAAREELGLTPRDGVLGELPPIDLPGGRRLRVVFEWERDSLSIGLTSATEMAETVSVATKKYLVFSDEDGNMSVLKPAVKQAEAFTRGEHVRALTKAGFVGKANLTTTAAVPAEVDRWLQQMTLTAQFAAVRQLHDLIREKGESPATLGALSRGYAHLGVLTDRQWGGHTWVFKARSLLYAERLRQRDEKCPWGYWHRGYAFALAGSENDAFTDFAAAGKRQGTVEPPAWVALAEHLCRFDTVKLRAAASDKGYADTAKLFEFLTVESYLSVVRTVRVGRELLQRVPDCYRVHDTLAQIGGVSNHHVSTVAGWKAFDDTFADRVLDLPGLPQAVRDAAKKGRPEPN